MKTSFIENLVSLIYICYLTVSPYDFSENIFKSINIMSYHKLNERNGVDADEFEDYSKKIIVPKQWLMNSDSSKVTKSRIQKRLE